MRTKEEARRQDAYTRNFEEAEETRLPFPTTVKGTRSWTEVGVAERMLIPCFASTPTAAARRGAISFVVVAGLLLPPRYAMTSTELRVDGVDAADLPLCSTSASVPTPPSRPTRGAGSIHGVVGVADLLLAPRYATTSTPPGDTARALPTMVTPRS